MKHRPTSYCATGQRQARLRDPRAGERERAFIEVPLFDEPMLLAIYEDHRGRTANAYRWPIWQGKNC